jgi:hypothetical protein
MIRDILGHDMSSDLDNYITGHYGEDQFGQPDEEDRIRQSKKKKRRPKPKSRRRGKK